MMISRRHQLLLVGAAGCFVALGVVCWMRAAVHPAGSRWQAAVALFATMPIRTLLRSAGTSRPSLRIDLIPPGDVYLGRGFSWTALHAQSLIDGAARDLTVDRLHALGRFDETDLKLPLPLLNQHVLLLGTTGVGKTRMLELLAVQAIRRGDATAVIDPKGDDRLLARVMEECRRGGRRLSIFSPFHPCVSVTYNPLASYVEAREVADRVAALLPAGGDAEPFRNFGWDLVNAVASALDRLGRSVSLVNVKHYGIDDPWALLRELYPKVNEPEKLAGRARRSGVPEFEALAAIASRPRDHSLKMASSLLPVLARLTAGVHRSLLSPDRPAFSWRDLDQRREVAYFYLGSLLGADTATAVARLTLLDLQSWIGMKYAFGHAEQPISLFVDELADVATPAFINVLNKGRGAGLRVVAAAQTQADLTAALGSAERAEQIVGNVNTVIQFRAQSQVDAELFSSQVGERLLPVTSDGEAYEPALFSSGLRVVDDFRAVFSRQRTWRAAPAVPAWAVMQLPPFHYFARWGHQVMKGVAPLMPAAPMDEVEAMKDEARRAVPGRPGPGLAVGLEPPRGC